MVLHSFAIKSIFILGFQAMPGSQVRQPRPPGQQQIRTTINARPITGQQPTAAAAAAPPGAQRVQLPPPTRQIAPTMPSTGARQPYKYTNAARNAQVQPGGMQPQPLPSQVSVSRQEKKNFPYCRFAKW
jgi:hypothetical protein